MKVIIKLAISQLRLHWIRTLLTSAAIIASVSLIVVMVGGFAVTLNRATDVARESFGRYDLAITLQEMRFGPGARRTQPPPEGARPQRPGGGASFRPDSGQTQRPPGGARPTQPGEEASFDPAFIGLLKSDSLVASISPVSEVRISPRNPNVQDRRRFSMTQLVGTDDEQPPDVIAEGKWLNLDDADSMNAVIDGGLARALQLKAGDDISFRLGGFGTEGGFTLKVIGITEQLAQASGMGGVYVPFGLFSKLTGRPPRISRIFVELDKDAEVTEFKEKWQERVASLGPSAQILTPASIEQNVAQSMNMSRGGFGALRYASSVISILASVFIIFTTLSIGVRERSRQLAILRAIGMTRAGVSSTIISEALMFALIGWLGGLAFGWLALHWTMRMPGELLAGNIPLELRTIFIAAICAFSTALVASLIPVISAIRSKPMDAMVPVHYPEQRKLPWVTMIIGLVLIVIALLTTTSKPIAKVSLTFFQFDMLTFPILLIGFVLIAPLIVIAVERLFAPILGRILGLERHLLSQQLSSNLWRTVGTTIALMIGLGLYITMQTWGRSMMIPFMLPGRAPDLVVTFMPNGIPSSEVDQITKVAGVKPNEVLPMIVEQPKLSKQILSLPELQDYWSGAADNVLLFGCDVEKTIMEEKSMITANFVRGDKNEAVRKVKEGGHCIITDQLYVRAPKYFDVGKTIAIESPGGEIGYTIAGVVDVPGWHWLSKMSGMRKESGRTAAILFMPFEYVARDFRIENPRVFLANVEDGADREYIKSKMQEIALLSAPQESGVLSSTVIAGRFYAGILDTNELRERFLNRSNSVIWLLSKYPLYALLIASLGIVNAVMASIRARRWEMGVLRGIGLTRSQLFRLVLAEAALIGLVACVLSFVFGVTEAWAGTVITGYRFGVTAVFNIPWGMLSIGFLIALVLCLLAALWPAWSTARSEPLQLLQAGRASM
jgi:putative ABC transport system permease protein